MRKTFYILALVLISFSTNAQTASPLAQTPSVEKSINEIQTGFLGIWAHNERRLSNSIALRTEIGLEAAVLGNSYYTENNRSVDYAFLPVLNIEPRWYYNLKRRLRHDHTIENNSGNFFGLRLAYSPSLFVISNIENIELVDQILIIPKYGIRRKIGQHFNYEVGFGIGYRYAFFDRGDYFFPPDNGGVAVDLHLRIGYTF